MGGELCVRFCSGAGCDTSSCNSTLRSGAAPLGLLCLALTGFPYCIHTAPLLRVLLHVHVPFPTSSCTCISYTLWWYLNYPAASKDKPQTVFTHPATSVLLWVPLVVTSARTMVLWPLPTYDPLTAPGKLWSVTFKEPDSESLDHCPLPESQHSFLTPSRAASSSFLSIEEFLATMPEFIGKIPAMWADLECRDYKCAFTHSCPKISILPPLISL